MDPFIILLGAVLAIGFLIAGVLDLIAAVGGAVPGERSQLENAVVGVIVIAVLRRVLDDSEPAGTDEDHDRVPLESELPPE